MNIFFSSILLFTVMCSAFAEQEGEVSKTYQLYHSLHSTTATTDPPFTPRGSITLSKTASSDKMEASVQHLNDCLDKDAWNELVKDGSGFYKIKVVEEDTGRSTITSIPSCEVRRANFRENIELIIGHTGSLISLSYAALVSPLASPCNALQPLNSVPTFQTKITFSTSKTGMTIPTVLPKMSPPNGLKWLPRASGSGGNAKGGSGEMPFKDPEEAKKERENQGFLRKYWYIILPLIITTFLNSEEPAAAPATQAAAAAATTTAAVGRTQQVQAQRGGVSGAAPTGGGGGTRQRRGQRSRG